jgi:prolyl-tRNA editing enzyme YbaK/EbsC (Cys-tRNA(Pro) deacylase)
MPDTRALGALTFEPAADRPELLAGPVRDLLPALDFPVWVAAVDPAVSDTAAFCAAYDVPMAASANCVLVTGKREGVERWAAAVVLATTRADVNGVIRRRVDVRKISFAPQDVAVELSGMEYGGITPIGLPADWPVLLDRAVADAGPVIIGAGIRGAKILVDGADLARLPGAEVLDDLARPVA